MLGKLTVNTITSGTCMTERLQRTSQCNSPKTVLLWDLNPGRFCILGRCSTNWATETAQLAGFKSHIQRNSTQGKVSQPENQVNSIYACTNYHLENWNSMKGSYISGTLHHTTLICGREARAASSIQQIIVRNMHVHVCSYLLGNRIQITMYTN